MFVDLVLNDCHPRVVRGQHYLDSKESCSPLKRNNDFVTHLVVYVWLELMCISVPVILLNL